MKADFFIVGGGLAGSLLAWFLHRRGSRVLVFDPEPELSCSKLAAGIINPVTGKRLVKSWRFEEFFAFARQTYREMEEEWGVALLRPHRIFRAFRQMETRNQWALRLGDEAYASLLAPLQFEPPEPGLFRTADAYGCICGAARLEIPLLLAAVRRAFDESRERQSAFFPEEFDYKLLESSPSGLSYKEHTASAVIFCEGHGVRKNPWFSYLPLNPAKGHVLHLSFESAMNEQQYMYKDGLYFVPLDAGTVWCGSDYIWDFADERPQPEHVRALQQRADEILAKPYETKGVFAAVRPTVKDRRPLLGEHPKYARLFIFNGLGTKGSSLGPWFASQMADLLLHGKAVDEEVDVRRFEV